MRRVVITGLGQVAPHGQDVAAGFEALLAGRSALGWHAAGEAPHSVMLASAVCAEVDGTSLLGRARAATMDRVSLLSAVAARSAWGNAGLEGLAASELERGCVFWGTGAGGLQTQERAYRDLFVKNRPRISPLTVVMGMNNAAAAHIAQLLGLGGACLTYSVACASSAVALAEGLRRIRTGECVVALAGGAEGAFPYGTVKAWQSMQVLAVGDEASAPTACRPFDAQRSGLVLGEGAAALVLEDREHALARGARIYAELAGAGASCDHSHLTLPNAGGQLRALRAALHDAGVAPEQLAYVNAHGTATQEGDLVEVDALRQLLGSAAPRVALSATKSMHGHLMGAAGALEALITTMVVHTGHIPPTAHVQALDPACEGLDHVLGAGRRGVGVPVALSNSFAFGGSNQVLVFRHHAA